MIFATFAFFLVTLAIGLSKIAFDGQTAQGLIFMLVGTLAYWAGSALKIALGASEARPRKVGFAIAGACTAAGAIMTVLAEVSFDAYGQEMHGIAWVLAGLIAGLLGTKPRPAPRG
ncbi:MAG: hypothetical protein RL735_2282 [Pseudomonadota bacterium]|jgi:hypothetical protein